MGFLAFALLLPESASVPVTQGYAAHRGAQTLHRPFVPERRPGSMGRLVPIAVPLPYPILRDMSRPAQAGVPPGTKSPFRFDPVDVCLFNLALPVGAALLLFLRPYYVASLHRRFLSCGSCYRMPTYT